MSKVMLTVFKGNVLYKGIVHHAYHSLWAETHLVVFVVYCWENHRFYPSNSLSMSRKYTFESLLPRKDEVRLFPEHARRLQPLIM
jgi:hypothetical protein